VALRAVGATNAQVPFGLDRSDADWGLVVDALDAVVYRNAASGNFLRERGLDSSQEQVVDDFLLQVRDTQPA
ncbi:MAG: hypothetical protein ACOC93_06055, partial [Planctomycetota bacterium]